MNELHLSLEQLRNALPTLKQSPKDNGTLKAIVFRPAKNERVEVDSLDVSPKGGIHGDIWAKKCWLTLPNGEPSPEAQVTLMNSRAADLIARERDRWSLAGDNLYVDLDLSNENLTAGQVLQIGTALFEITPLAHNGCGKFRARFGADALDFVNSDEGKNLHLRGIYTKVIQEGVISVGDPIVKVQS